MTKTLKMVVPVPIGTALPCEVQVKTLDDNLTTYQVWGWRRDSDIMMTLIVIEDDSTERSKI